MKLYLYGTEGCHLCHLAEQTVAALKEEFDLQVQQVDVSATDDLIGRYGIRIPVVRVDERIDDLGWPFDTAVLQRYLSGEVIVPHEPQEAFNPFA